MDRYIEILKEVREIYFKIGCLIFFFCVINFERVFGILVRIYFKYEGVMVMGSYKINIVLV